MDTESSTKFIGSLTKFLQSLCNGYVEFDDGVELIGHIYLSVDAGKTGKTLNYFLNEKVCKNDNSVTFISNSFHAQAEKSKEKDGENRKADDDIPDSGDNVPRSTNAGTMPFRPQGSRSGASPNQHRMGMPVGTKRPGSPLKGPPSQRRAPTPPSQRRFQSSGSRGAVGGSPVSKTVPSSPSSSSQDNAPSPSPARRSREISQPTSNQSDNVGADNENDIPPNVLSINPTPEFASFLGSLTSDNQTSQDQHSPPDTKPDTDVTFIKEEYVSEPTSCAQSGSSGQHSGRSGEDSSGLYPVMLHQNPSVFPGSSGYSNYQGGASSTATSQQPAFPGSSQSDFSPVPGTSQDGADPSGCTSSGPVESPSGQTVGSDGHVTCDQCSTEFSTVKELQQHTVVWHSDSKAGQVLPETGHTFRSPRPSHRKKKAYAVLSTEKQADTDRNLYSSKASDEDLPVCFSQSAGGEAIQLKVEEGACEVLGEADVAVANLGLHHCPICQKTFRYSFNLRRHLNTHLNYFQHACFICGRGFHRSDFMLRHVRTVHKNIIGADPQAH